MASVHQAPIGIPCFATEFKPVVVQQVLQDELNVLNAIYGDDTIEVIHAHNGRITTELRLPGTKLPPLQLAFPVDYPQNPPEVLDFNFPTCEKTYRIRSSRLVVLSVLQAQFVEGFECMFDLLESCLPILSLLGENGLDMPAASYYIPGFIADQWLWTTTANVNLKDIKAIGTCAVCLDENYTFKMVCLPCKHHYCLECFQTGWTVSLNSATPFTCCQMRIALEVIKTFNASRTLEIRRYIRMLQEMDTNQPFYCGFASCNAVIGSIKECNLRSRAVQKNGVACPECHAHTCARCRMPWHGGKCNDDHDIGKLLDEDIFRRCPKCGQGIEKNGGCSHMICTACGSNFSWESNGAVTLWAS